MVVIILIIFGLICAMVAHGKGRSPIGWFCIGFIAPLLGMILVFVLPDQKKAESRYNRLGQQNRRLRERLRQHQLANRQKLARVNRRLTAHDRSLDLDTTEDDSAPALAYEDEDAGEEDEDALPYTEEEEFQDAPPARPAARPRQATRPAVSGAAPRPLPPQARPVTGTEYRSPTRAIPARPARAEPPEEQPRPPTARRPGA